MLKTDHVLRLIELLSERTGQPLDFYGFRQMSECMDTKADISPRYLDDLYRSMTKKSIKGIKTNRASRFHLDSLASYMGFKNFQEFSNSINVSLSPILLSCTGNWWSYVRANSDKYIFRAPVRMFLDKSRQSIRLELKGKERIFSGKIEEKGSCISGFLESGTYKRIGLVFKLGDSLQIELLQGVFCGISSSGDPIAGREILVKEAEMDFNQMKWSKHSLHDKSVEENIREYFSDPEKNCIKIKEVRGFGLTDL